MAALNTYACIAVKIGSSLLVNEKNGEVNQNWLRGLGEDIAKYSASRTKILIISSGAIALGRKRLGLGQQTLSLTQKQACAAAGQALLAQAYETVLAPHGLVTAQALLTIHDTENRRRWMNAKATLTTLLSLGAIPIINENDTVATEEIRYGDNDRLAARVAQMVGADLLVLLSDVDGLYDMDPRVSQEAHHIPHIANVTPAIMAMGGDVNKLAGMGSGGMATKLQAAKIATQAGCAMVITKGDCPHPLSTLDNSTMKASWFAAKTNTLLARKQWIANTLKPQGTIVIDNGAARALLKNNSLLCVGVTGIQGQFGKGEAVTICGSDGVEIGKGLSNYNAQDARKIIGMKSKDIETIIGYDNGTSLVHYDNMVLTS